ncbi:hypothetical protein COEREDRAFT_97281 [Coemansia reversa NRRL 1564]|uniref:Uncharacterized protein n=1 Tax=Coemansia reversa (strain ATCC 12441 / NRRL 1564) TaxID=763665 RepID=A0A2G5BCK3_COERN|nr:hypothetical protein COEREDRAFT_97281 [Coemansia reversa NRRL 1564]|eukprot:PIA16712.1 hypothetical protein COEREDRAFT_97281 [Coemansia reversa NRRL 1564]
MEYLTRIPVFRAAPQKHSPVRNVAQIKEQCRASSRPTRIPPPLGRQQSLKTPPTNQGFAFKQPPFTGHLCDRHLGSQQKKLTQTETIQRSGATTKAQSTNKRGLRLQVDPVTSPSSNTTSAFPSEQNITPDTGRDSNHTSAWSAEQQHTAVRGRASSDSHIHISEQQTNRSSMGSPPQHSDGLATPDSCISIKECCDRIERLLQRAQQMRRKCEPRQALAPPQTPMHPDKRRALSPNTHTNATGGLCHSDIICSTASSVATEAIGNSDALDTSVKSNSSKSYSPRRDSKTEIPDAEAGTTQGFLGTKLVAETPAERTREKLALLRARRASQLREIESGSPQRDSETARTDAETGATQEFFGTKLAAETPAERTREKLALLRARRASQLGETEPDISQCDSKTAIPYAETGGDSGILWVSQLGETEPDISQCDSKTAIPYAETGATQEFFGTKLAAETPVERTREKLALLRARRASQLSEDKADNSTSELTKEMVRMRSESSMTTFYHSDERDEDNDAGFFESSDNLILFREIERTARDITWDKRVFYYHVSRTNKRFRHATEDITIADCRDSCLADLADQQGATHERNSSGARDALASCRHSRDAPNARQQQDAADVAGFGEQMEDDDDDWWLDRFGYIDFRRRSCSSMESTTSLLSPAPEESSAPPTPPPACKSPEPLASLSYATSGRTWSINSSTARVATANFNKAISTAAATASPQLNEEFFYGSLLDKEDPAAKPISAVDAEEAAYAQLRIPNAEKCEFNHNVLQARAAIQALTRLVLRAM